MNSYLYLDSVTKSHGSNSKANYNLSLDLQNVNSVGLSSYEMSYNIKNINETNKDSVYVDDGTTSYPVSLAVGWHNYTELATVIQTGLNTSQPVGTPFSVSYSSATHSYTITSTFAFTLKKLSSGRTWIDMLDIQADTPLSLTQAGGDNININYTSKIYIVSNKLHSYKQVGDFASLSLNNVLGVIYLVENEPQQLDKADVNAPKSIYPKILSKRLHHIKWIPQDRSRVLTSIDVSLLDDYGKPIPDDIKYTLELLTQ